MIDVGDSKITFLVGFLGNYLHRISLDLHFMLWLFCLSIWCWPYLSIVFKKIFMLPMSIVQYFYRVIQSNRFLENSTYCFRSFSSSSIRVVYFWMIWTRLPEFVTFCRCLDVSMDTSKFVRNFPFFSHSAGDLKFEKLK